MGQGESLATTLDPLVERQSPCRTTSDREPRQGHARSRQGDLQHSTKKTERDLRVAATGLPPTTAPTHLHPQEKRQKASSRYSRYEMQGHASSLPARSGPSSGNHG